MGIAATCHGLLANFLQGELPGENHPKIPAGQEPTKRVLKAKGGTKNMASTLGVLDVLSRLREESERASTALAAQEVK